MRTSPFLMLTWSSLKAYFRNRGAIFFSLLVPVMIMTIFGLINFGSSTATVNIGVVDQASNQVSGRIIAGLKQVKAVKLHTGSLVSEKHELEQGNRDLVAVLPSSIGQGSTAILAYYNQGNPQNSQVAIAIMNQFVDRASFAFAGVSRVLTLDTKPVQSRNGWLHTITQYSPLSNVSDALRSISIDGASLWSIRTDLLGIVIWLAVAALIATRLFKWEVV